MPLNSLRLQLLGWLLVPLAVVVAVNTWAIYTNAIETATVVQDRMLLGAVRIIAEQTYYKDGELHVEVPPAECWPPCTGGWLRCRRRVPARSCSATSTTPRNWLRRKAFGRPT